VEEKVEERLDDFKLQEIVNTVWAFATVDQGAPKLFEAVAGKTDKRIEDFNPQELSNTVWVLLHWTTARLRPSKQWWRKLMNA
jgi:hypothetical protein